MFFCGCLGVYEQGNQKNKEKQTHGPELADADDGLCFLVFCFLLKKLSPQESEKLSPQESEKTQPP